MVRRRGRFGAREDAVLNGALVALGFLAASSCSSAPEYEDPIGSAAVPLVTLGECPERLSPAGPPRSVVEAGTRHGDVTLSVRLERGATEVVLYTELANHGTTPVRAVVLAPCGVDGYPDPSPSALIVDETPGIVHVRRAVFGQDDEREDPVLLARFDGNWLFNIALQTKTEISPGDSMKQVAQLPLPVVLRSYPRVVRARARCRGLDKRCVIQHGLPLMVRRLRYSQQIDVGYRPHLLSVEFQFDEPLPLVGYWRVDDDGECP